MSRAVLVIGLALLDPIFGSLPSCNGQNGGCAGGSSSTTSDPTEPTEPSPPRPPRVVDASQCPAIMMSYQFAMAFDPPPTGDAGMALIEDCAHWKPAVRACLLAHGMGSTRDQAEACFPDDRERARIRAIATRLH